jgi:hypothetical protein
MIQRNQNVHVPQYILRNFARKMNLKLYVNQQDFVSGMHDLQG